MKALDSRDGRIDYALSILRAIRRGACLSEEERKRMDIAIDVLASETSEMRAVLESRDRR